LGGELVPCPDNDISKIDTALEIINKYYSFCGLLEYFDASLFLMGKKLEFNPDGLYYLRKNVKRKKENISLTKEIYNFYYKYNKLDFILYEKIKERFLKEFEKMGSYPLESYDYNIKNDLYKKVIWYFNKYRLKIYNKVLS